MEVHLIPVKVRVVGVAVDLQGSLQKIQQEWGLTLQKYQEWRFILQNWGLTGLTGSSKKNNGVWENMVNISCKYGLSHCQVRSLVANDICVSNI